jgi:hypothetical protein
MGYLRHAACRCQPAWMADPAMSWAWVQDSAGRPSGGSGGRVATLTTGTDDRIGVIRLMVASENSGQPPGFEML